MFCIKSICVLSLICLQFIGCWMAVCEKQDSRPSSQAINLSTFRLSQVHSDRLMSHFRSIHAHDSVCRPDWSLMSSSRSFMTDSTAPWLTLWNNFKQWTRPPFYLLLKNRDDTLIVQLCLPIFNPLLRHLLQILQNFFQHWLSPTELVGVFAATERRYGIQVMFYTIFCYFI